MRESATAEVEQARRAADEDAALVRAEADRYAEEVRSRADVDASETLSRAKREADSIIDDAAREAAARREEAEAYFEKQRATAAASAADFERTLGERRERSSAEFTAQMAKQDQALAAVQERADLLAREAEEDRQAKATEAARVLESARAEATALVTSAKDQAERVRRDSERELAAATARRDSITAQLSNVRNMLATLGGGAALGALTDDETAEPAPEAVEEALPVEDTEAHDEAEVTERMPVTPPPRTTSRTSPTDARSSPRPASLRRHRVLRGRHRAAETPSTASRPRSPGTAAASRRRTPAADRGHDGAPTGRWAPLVVTLPLRDARWRQPKVPAMPPIRSAGLMPSRCSSSPGGRRCPPWGVARPPAVREVVLVAAPQGVDDLLLVDLHGVLLPGVGPGVGGQ